MYSFQTRGGGAVTIEADFSRHDYANLSFFDTAGQDILLHLSLRAREGLAVFNRRIGGVWEAERPRPLVPWTGPAAVCFRFPGAGVEITNGGTRLLVLDATQCPRTEAIGGFDCHGGFLTQTIRPEGPAHAERRAQGGLSLALPFEIVAWAQDPALGRQDLALSLDGVVALQPLLVENPAWAPALDRGGVAGGALLRLPGWIWQGRDPGTPLVARLSVNGLPAGDPLVIDPAEIGRVLEAILPRPGVETWTQFALTALEHLRLGPFWSGLSPRARAGATRIARHFGLQAHLPQDGAMAPPRAPRPDPAPEEVWAQAFLARFRADPGLDLVAEAAVLPDLPAEALQRLCDRLTDPFCARDRFEVLAAAAAARGLQPGPGQGAAWVRVQRLPWLLHAGRFEWLAAEMAGLVPGAGDWIETAPLAWVIRRLADTGGRIPTTARARAIEAALALLSALDRGHGGRAVSVDLIDALVGLLAAPVLGAPLERQVARSALQVLGLSRRFWETVSAAEARGDLPPDPERAAAARAFGRIADHLAGRPVAPPEIEAALTLFETLGAPDAGRFRRECLGPLGLADAVAPQDLPLHLARRPEGLGAAALRALAFPADPLLIPTPVALSLAPALRDALDRAEDTVANGPHSAAAAALSRDLHRALAQDAAVDDALFHRLAALARPEARGIGLALGLAALRELARKGGGGQAGLTRRLITLLDGMTDETRASLSACLSVQTALAALEVLSGPEVADPGPILSRLVRHTDLVPPPPEDADPGLDAPPFSMRWS